jgi:hypothetical protein
MSQNTMSEEPVAVHPTNKFFSVSRHKGMQEEREGIFVQNSMKKE